VEERGSDDLEPVVVQPPKRLFLIWAPIASALAACGIYALPTDAYLGMFRPEVLVFMGLTLLVLMAFQLGRRIVEGGVRIPFNEM
jgi:hypothetical protein